MDDLPEPVRVLSGYSTSASIHSSLTALLKQTVEKESKKQPTPKGYLIVTDLVNPTSKVRELLCPNLPLPQDIARRLKTGTKLHAFAAPWFRGITGYTEEESILDGAFVDVPGVRGRLDSFINNSIIEFKTKDQTIGEDIPSTPDEVAGKYPQDLEQVAFYAALHPDQPKTNYLVFMRANPPQDLRAFKITINDISAVKHLLKERIESLKTALEKRDDANLGRCRYHGKGCHYQQAKACVCDSLKPYDMGRLLKHVKIEADGDFTKKIEDARKAISSKQKELFYPSSVLYPRMHFARVKASEDVTGGSRGEDYWHYESCLWHCVRKMGFPIDESDKLALVSSEDKIKCKSNWKKIPMSGKEDGVVVPFLNKVSKAGTIQTKPSAYAIAELAIVCALYDKPRGLIFVMYPKVGKQVHVFDVKFDDLSGIKREIKARLELLESAITKNDPTGLPALPSFMSVAEVKSVEKRPASPK